MKLISLLGSVKTTNAVVLKVGRKGITVSPNASCDKPPGCQNCTACGPTESKHTFFCSVSDPSAYSIGQCIYTTYFLIHELLAAFIVFGLPILCALAAFVVCSIYSSAGPESPGVILATVAALFGGFLLIYFIERITRILFPVSIAIDHKQS